MPEFRIILAEKTSAANKKFTEVLGHYNPRTKAFGVKEDRLKYWMDQHVTMSPTVHNLFVSKKLVEGDKVKAFTIPPKPVTEEAPAAESVAVAAETAPESAESVTEAPAAEAGSAEEQAA